MADDDSLTPRLGRQHQQRIRPARRYLGRVLAAANLARGSANSPAAGKGRFTGSRIGRGAGIGRLLASRGGYRISGRRRAIVKASIVRLSGKGASAAAAHLRYLQRDGTTRDGERGALYGRDSDAVDGTAFNRRGVGDRHQFRFIVSPEDGHQYEDLQPLTRRLMARMEEDLGSELDWVAVDHFNTGHPHTHVVVRGKDATGADLIIARDYLTVGIRERAVELVELDLGPRTEREIAATLRSEIGQERLTSLDRSLLKAADLERIVSSDHANAFEQSLRAGRLKSLERLGLAIPIGAGRFQLAPDLAGTLRQMGERADIIRTMQREFAARDNPPGGADQAIYDPALPDSRKLVGRVAAHGLADEHADRHYLIVDAVDGRSHYVAIGRGPELLPGLAPGAIVRVEPAWAEVRDVDRVIARVAAVHGGHYGIEAHLAEDPRASEAFVEAHVRRLEAMRKEGVLVEREASGRWAIPADYPERVEALEKAELRERPVAVTILSLQPLEKLVHVEAATWIDRELVSSAPEPLRAAGFGRDVGNAQALRRQWLVAQGFAEEGFDGAAFPRGMIAALQRRELLRVAAQLSGELKLPFVELADGETVEGICRRSVDMISGRFTLVERARDFALVPWRPVLERQLGKAVSGIMRDDGISWTIGRGRGGPSIS